MAYRLSDPAVADLEAIYETSVEQFGEVQADRYAAKLAGMLKLLADHPRAARERTEIRPPVRACPVGSHVIVYELNGEDVLILRVRHGREDWTNDPLG